LPGDLTEELPLSPVLNMVDRESGDNNIERSKWRQRIFQTPLSKGHSMVAVESISGMTEHGRRGVHGQDTFDAASVFEYQGRQPPVTTTQVQNGAR
jgi:hypothetical protein